MKRCNAHHAHLPPIVRMMCLITLCFFPMWGCSQLPIVQPADITGRAKPIVLEDASGPLTAARSRLLLDGLTSGAAQGSHLQHHLAAEEAITGSPIYSGNKVQLLRDGPATYEAMRIAIANARYNINVETYILDNDEVGRGFTSLLIDKQRQGVQVNIIRDSVGTYSTPSEFFREMTASGIRIVEFNPINPLAARRHWSPNQRDHRKLLIVDGEQAFMGGINISSVHSGSAFGKKPQRYRASTPAWRDTDLKLEGPVVGELQNLFVSTWEKQQGEGLSETSYFPALQPVGETLVRAIGSTPDEAYSQMYGALISAIGHARTSVYLTNAYFAPDPQLLAALEAAQRRGVDVRLILPSKTDSWLVLHAGRGYYTRLLKAGVKIFELRTAILHSKTALVDGVWASVGSTNLDWRSFLHNQELDAVVLGEDFGKQVQAMFDRDLANSDPVSLADWQRRTLDLRLKEWFARL